jgi:hypothetical protein
MIESHVALPDLPTAPCLKFLLCARAISRTQRLGFVRVAFPKGIPRLKALETLVLPLHHRCIWSQWWELNPHTLTYEVSTLPLGDTATIGG